MKLTDKEKNNLQREIDHILDSGANSIRLLNMIDIFLERRDIVNQFLDTFKIELEKVIRNSKRAKLVTITTTYSEINDDFTSVLNKVESVVKEMISKNIDSSFPYDYDIIRSTDEETMSPTIHVIFYYDNIKKLD